MKKQNIFTTIAVASLILGQVGQLSVLAKEQTPSIDSEKQEVQKEYTEQELLELALQKAQELEFNAKKGLDTVTPAYQEAEKAYTNGKTNYAAAQSTRNEAQIAANDAIVAELEKQLAELEDKKGILSTSEEEKKALEDKMHTIDSEIEKAKENLAKKEKELEDAKKEFDSQVQPEEISKAEQAVEEAKKALAQQEQDLATVTREHEEAVKAVETAKADVQKWEADITAKQSALTSAEEELNQANQAVADAQAIYDATQDEGKKAEAQQALNDAKAKLTEAQNRFAFAQSATLTAKQNLTIAQGELAGLEQQVQDKDAAIAEVQKKIEEADTNVAKKEAELTQAKQEAQGALQKVEAAKAKYTEAEAKAKKAYDLLTTLGNEKTELENQIADQEKSVADLKAEADAVQAKIAQGSKGFFEANGYTNAMGIIDEGINKHGSTHLGDKNDATSLENMKATLQYIKQCNEIRRKDGLSELKVSAELMAIAQVQLNHTNSKGGLSHSGLYEHVSENLAGYTNQGNLSDPFERWYSKEKVVYLDAVAKNPEIAKLSSYQLSIKYPELYHKVGHYLNIVDKNAVATGYAITPISTSSNNAGQVFAADWSEYNRNLENVDTFFAKFETYYTGLMGAQGRYEEAKAKLESMRNDLQAKITEAQSANDAFKQAQNETANAQVGVENAMTEHQAAQDKVARVEKELEAIENGTYLQELNKQLNTLNGEKTSLLQQVDAKNGEIQKKEQGVQEAIRNEANAQKDVEDAQNLVDRKQDIVNSLTQGAEEAKAKLDAAIATQKEVQGTYDTVKADYEKAVHNKELAEQGLAIVTKVANEKEEAVKTATTTVANQKETLKKAQSRLEFLLDKVGFLEKLEGEIETQKGVVSELEAFKVDAPEKIDTVSKKIAALKEAMAEQETLVAQIQAVQANYKALLKDPSAQIQDVESKHQIIAELNGKVNALAMAYAEEEKALEALKPLQEGYEAKRTDYLKAKKAYEEAKTGTKKAMDALNAYLDAQKPNGSVDENTQKPNDSVEEETQKPTTDDTVEESQKHEGTNTGVTTGLGLGMLGMFGGLAGAAVLHKKKKED